MKKIKIKCLTFLSTRRLLPACLAAALASPAAVAGLHVENGLLLDGYDNPFVMRGVNHPHVWYTSRTRQALDDIAGVGANAVRVVLGNGQQWGPTPAEEVARIIEQCKQNKMIAILEIHDVTGYGEKPGAAPLSTAVDYWLSIQNVLMGQEDYVIVNIGNEPLGNLFLWKTWARIHQAAIERLRGAGFTHTLMIDAPNWGQDWAEIMLRDAPAVFATDPLKNLVFSVHMYQVYARRSKIDNYMSTFVNQHRLPLVVGEFGADHQGAEVDEASILELAEFYRLGYLGWSWSGNTGGVESLDITQNFNVNQLTPWGDFLINSANGIRATSQPATIYTDGQTEPRPPGALEQSLRVKQDQPVNITLSATDADGHIVDYSIVTQPDHGTLTGNGQNRTYLPTSGFTGNDAFTFTATDNNGLVSTPARINIAVTGEASGRCDYVITQEWNNGFTAAIRITNRGDETMNGWRVNWVYSDSTTITNSWNANLSGDNPYYATNMSWNAQIPPGQTVEFGFQGVKGTAAASVPVLSGDGCE